MPSSPALGTKRLSAALPELCLRATMKQHKNVTNMALEKTSIAAVIEALNALINSDTVMPSKGAR